jgi:ADP-ribosylation factor family
MFTLVSGLYTEYFSAPQVNLLVVGVTGSGKTTILERIKVTSFATHSINATGNQNYNVDDTAIAAAAAAAAVTGRDIRSKEDQRSLHKGSIHQAHGNLGPTPELLRSKIFLADSVDEYQAPSRRRSRHNRNLPVTVSNSQHHPPLSRFAWICPPPPKFRSSVRMDASDRSSNSNFVQNLDYDDDDDEFSNDAFENHHMDHPLWETNIDNDEDDDCYHDDNDEYTDQNDDTMDTTLLSTTSMASARSRRSAASGSSNGPRKNIRVSHGGGPLGLPAPRRITSSSSQHDDLRRSSMESVDLNDKPQRLPSHSSDTRSRSFLADIYEGPVVASFQFDLKPGTKMLPLERIRPTIGMNLGKTEICGAKVHVWDLGGKLLDLWERYYDDADAVLFVWRLCREDVARMSQESSQDGNEDEDDIIRVTAEQQKKVLEQVRSAVPDDVPFCLLGHLFQLQPPYNCEPDVLYSTSQVLPHYHNPLQALFMANAVSGQGLKTALEWLISTAKRQQRIRKRVSDV